MCAGHDTVLAGQGCISIQSPKANMSRIDSLLDEQECEKGLIQLLSVNVFRRLSIDNHNKEIYKKLQKVLASHRIL